MYDKFAYFDPQNILKPPQLIGIYGSPIGHVWVWV